MILLVGLAIIVGYGATLHFVTRKKKRKELPSTNLVEAENAVSSLANELGIKLESDNEEEYY